MSASDSESGALSQEEIAHQFLLPERQVKVNQLMRRIDTSTDEDVKYCICQSSDCSRFMIGCDNCNGWYHGDCIGVTQSDARSIKCFYCDLCRAQDPRLEIRYKSKRKIPSDQNDADYVQETRSHSKHKISKKSSRRCGQCTACHRTEDCRRCDFCKDMIKYGGTNKIRQKCRLRQCLNFGIIACGGSLSKENVFQESHKKQKLSDMEKRQHSQSKKKWQSHTSSSDITDRDVFKKRGPHSYRYSSSGQGASSDLSRKGQIRERKRWHHPKSGDVNAGDYDVDSKRQCFGPGCIDAARVGSKYCSDECGMKLAKSRLCELLPAKIHQWQSTQCVAEENNQKQLESIRSQQQEARKRLQELDVCLHELDSIIDQGKKMKTDPCQEAPDTDDEGEWSIYCVTCGCEINQKTALRHMERCFTKYEAQTSFGSIYKTRIEGSSMFCDFYNPQTKTYCKRLKALCPEHSKEPKIQQDEICGSPLMNTDFKETGKLCQISKRKCNRHYCWEKLRRAEIDLQRVSQWLKLDELFEQERNIRLAMSNRMGVLGLLLHQTIDHDPLNPMRPRPT